MEKETDNAAFVEKIAKLDRLHRCVADKLLGRFRLHRSQHAVLAALALNERPLTPGGAFQAA